MPVHVYGHPCEVDSFMPCNFWHSGE